jgi:hypothetical protein
MHSIKKCMNDLSNLAPSEKDSATSMHVMYVDVPEITRLLPLVHQETIIKGITTQKVVKNLTIFGK